MDFDLKFHMLSKREKLFLYVDNMSTIFNEKALFSDGTEFYRSPAEPMPGDDVRIRFRTARCNVDKVYLIADGEEILMEYAMGDKLFDYYEAVIHLQDRQIAYFFKVFSGNLCCYYNAVGVTQTEEEYYHFHISPGYTTPAWAKGAVFYQVYLDRFCNGDPSNDVEDNEYNYIGESVKHVEDWYRYPEAMDVRNFYGGDLAGLWSKLDYLQDLGVECIYLNPMFVSPSNHKYDIQDYDYIDPHFGKIVVEKGENLPEGTSENSQAEKYISRVTDIANLNASNEYFAQFVEEVHRRGMKVILDGVFNHCGSFNKWLDKERIYEGQEGYEAGAYVAEDSPYHSFFKFYEDQWPYNGSYDGWWGHDTLPKLNYEESQTLFDYIMQIGRKWVSPPYNVDGWRLDVAADLGHSTEYNHYFWKEFRRNVKEANPNAIILAEHYGEPTEWLQGDEWDTVMNYDAFMEPVTWFLTGMQKHSDEYRQDMLGNADNFFGSMRHFMTRFNTQSLQVAMNELSNHDHSRFLTRTNHRVGRVASAGTHAADEGVNKAVMRLAVMIQMTWPGAPTIYYGDEAGVCGWTDPDSRRTYPWGREDKELIEYHKQLIRIHKENQALKTGSIIFLHGQRDFISYARFQDNQKFVVVINVGEGELTVDVPVWQAGIVDTDTIVRLITTTRQGVYNRTDISHCEGGSLKVTIPAQSGILFKTLQ